LAKRVRRARKGFAHLKRPDLGRGGRISAPRGGAAFNVLTGRRYGYISTPFANLVMGKYGHTPGPVNPEVLKKCSRGKERFTDRPASYAEPVDLDAVRAAHAGATGYGATASSEQTRQTRCLMRMLPDGEAVGRTHEETTEHGRKRRVDPGAASTIWTCITDGEVEDTGRN